MSSTPSCTFLAQFNAIPSLASVHSKKRAKSAEIGEESFRLPACFPPSSYYYFLSNSPHIFSKNCVSSQPALPLHSNR
ncbi:unnamed protein product [Caenorhabditis angaria]|uniref:Uncharacterized protein n=1 Tax=Caenorhabditis angaria TaxID=860376 RepID=A0A9P1NBW2_9PELO|nr:unnamed protein product [Caenorhabditis angaria]